MTTNKVELKYANTLHEAQEASDSGYEPVECAFGKTSIVGSLQLDHHGSYSHLNAVSIRAAKYALEGKEKYQFVIAGSPDNDQMYAVAALSHNIPIKLEDAEAIAELDTDLIGRDQTLPRYIKSLMFEQRTHGISRDLPGAEKALEILVDLYSRDIPKSEIEKAIDKEEQRRKRMISYVVSSEKDKIALAVSPEKGFPEWYQIAPVVVSYNPEFKSISIGLCPKRGPPFSEKNGFDLLGEKGLMPLYSLLDEKLNKKGHGGREVVGGSPRGLAMSYEDALKTYAILKSEIEGK